MEKYIFTHKAYMSRSEIEELYDLTVQAGTDAIVFYDGGVTDRVAWADMIERQEAWLVRAQDHTGRVVGFWWLNNYLGKTAMMHFCILRLTHEGSVDIGRATMRYMAELGILESVYGLTPKHYRHVFKFLRELGFEILGDIPGACYLTRKGRYVPGRVSTYKF